MSSVVQALQENGAQLAAACHSLIWQNSEAAWRGLDGRSNRINDLRGRTEYTVPHLATNRSFARREFDILPRRIEKQSRPGAEAYESGAFLAPAHDYTAGTPRMH